ncbi:MAG: aminotransferase class III-fold pyridoxal phosphate-dependent enzyme, partial [Alphaproteobacteria bacterium]
MVTNLTAVLQDMDRKHHMHPFSDTKALNEKGVRIITKAEGCHMWTSEGERILDGMAGLWCVNIGYGRKELAEVAYKQMQELPYYNTFFQTSTQPTTELSAKLAEVTPEGLNHVFYANSGSEANDTIAKMVRWYWNTKGKKSKKTIISR